jgi:DNA-binding SARP family transcriptional activator
MVADRQEGSSLPCFRFLGEFRTQWPAAPRDLPILGKAREVLAFLAFNANKEVRRATLSNLIWADHTDHRSRANLNTALWRINRALKTLGTDDLRLHINGTQLKLSVAPRVFIDVVALEASVRQAAELCKDGHKVSLPPGIGRTLVDVLTDDCEGFLEGWSSEWVLIERERFFNLQIRGLAFLMQDLAESRRIEEALEYGRRILRMDPMRECVQRQVMWLHVLNGHQGNAIRQYLDYARTLQTELGVSPMPETRALYEFIIAQNPEAKTGGPERRKSGVLFPPAQDPHPDRTDAEPGVYDVELTRLRSLMTRLDSHRQSVFSALARGGVS